VLDGGSTDASPAIIHDYASRCLLEEWPEHGQASALIRAFSAPAANYRLA
jgi:hypothetical protein